MTPPTASPERVTVEVEFEPREVFLALLRAYAVRLAIGIAIVAMLPILILMILGAIHGDVPFLAFVSRVYTDLMVWVLMIAFVALPLGYLWFLARKVAVEDPASSRGSTIGLGDTGCTFENELATGEVAWEAFSSAVETVDAFIISRAAGHKLILPKRCFTSDRDIDRCRSILAENIEDARLRG